MAALDMRGEHHVNTILCQKKKQKFESTPPPLVLGVVYSRPRQRPNSAGKQNKKKTKGEATQCKAGPLYVKTVNKEVEEEEKETKVLPAKWRAKKLNREEMA